MSGEQVCGQVEGGMVEQWWWYGLGGKGGAGVVLVCVDRGLTKGWDGLIKLGLGRLD